MTPSSTVSVVVPVYNVSAFLDEAITSIIHQTIKPNEVIIVDDGSSDDTSEILQRYYGLPNYKIIKTANNGLGSARNLGRMVAKSEYIYFFDSDDLLESKFIEHMHWVVKEYDRPDVIMFSGQSFYEDGFDRPVKPPYKRTISGFFKRDDGLITEMEERGESWASACLYLSKAELWSKNRLAFPPILHEDEAVLFPLLALSEKTVILPEVYFHRRVRAGSIMTSGVDTRNVSGMLRVVHETIEFMAREPALVEPDIGAWRARVTQFGARYVDLCRKTGTRISWAAVIASLITARSIGYSLRIIYRFLPGELQALFRTVRSWGIAMLTSIRGRKGTGVR